MARRSLVLVAIVLLIAGAWFLQKQKWSETSAGVHLGSHELVIYAYSSFAASWGAGPKLVEEFKKTHKGEVRIIDAGDAKTLVRRAEMEGAALGADLVIGFDQFTVAEARALDLWMTQEPNLAQWDSQLPQRDWRPFVPYDWAPMGFIYRKSEAQPPKSLKELVEPRWKAKISAMDPRTSTPGYQLLDWVYQTLGESQVGEFLKLFQGSIQTVSPSWSAAYGLFKKKQAALAFSYSTSVAYHWVDEGDFDYQFAVFDEGHPAQIEFFAMNKNCKNCDAAKAFATLILSEKGQQILATSNYMFPAVAGVALPEAWGGIPRVRVLPIVEKSKEDIQKVLSTWQLSDL